MTEIVLHVRDYRLGSLDAEGNVVWPAKDFEHNDIYRPNASTLTVAHPDGAYHFIVIPAGKDTGDLAVVFEGAEEAPVNDVSFEAYVVDVDYAEAESFAVASEVEPTTQDVVEVEAVEDVDGESVVESAPATNDEEPQEPEQPKKNKRVR